MAVTHFRSRSRDYLKYGQLPWETAERLIMKWRFQTFSVLLWMRLKWKYNQCETYTTRSVAARWHHLFWFPMATDRTSCNHVTVIKMPDSLMAHTLWQSLRCWCERRLLGERTGLFLWNDFNVVFARRAEQVWTGAAINVCNVVFRRKDWTSWTSKGNRLFNAVCRNDWTGLTRSNNRLFN